MIVIGLYALLLLFAVRAVVAGDKKFIYIAAFCLPVSVSMPEYFGTLAAPVNVIMIGTGLLVLFHPKGRRPATDRLPMKVLVTLTILVFVEGLAIHGFREMGGQAFTRPFYEIVRFTWHWSMPLLLYAFVFRSTGPGFSTSRLSAAVQASMLLECLVALSERASGANRASAHLGEDNQAGAYFAGAAGFFLAHFLMERGAKRWGYLVAWLLAVGALFATLSRGGMVAGVAGSTAVAILFVMLEGRRTGTKFLFAVLAIVVALNFAVLVPQEVKNRVLETFGSAGAEAATEEDLDISARMRLEYWLLAIDLFKENPFGWGSLSFPDILLARHGARKTTHNVYLLVLVEQGIQGFVVFMALVGSVLALLLREFRYGRGDPQRTLALALLGWWSAHLVAHFFLNSFFTPMVIGQFWMLLACLAAGTFYPDETAPVPAAAGAKPRSVPAIRRA